MQLLKIFLLIFLAFQIIQVDQLNPKYDKKTEIKVPKDVMAVFKKSCWDCHSNDTAWPWYAKIAPLSWTISQHVKNGRAYVNFSIWETYTKEQKDKKLDGIYRTIISAMPPPSYISWHKEAKTTKEDIELIRNWTGKTPY
jgi:hypothetical protein